MAERKYSVTKNECLAIILAFKKFYMRLYGASFQIQTDHQAPSRLNNPKNPTGRLARKALTLQAYDNNAHKKGVANAVAGALSRAPSQIPSIFDEPRLMGLTGTMADTLESRLGQLFSRAELRQAQKKDKRCRRVCD